LFLPLGKPLSSTFTAMGVRKGDPDFLNYLNTWLAFQRDEGWLGERTAYWSSATEWMK
jgi:polar amino acid transport system substrate-binding protein